MWESLWQSFLLIAATEMGDKTQLLAILLVTRFRKPKTILAGIFCATVLNHALASSFGLWLTQNIAPKTLEYALSASFLLFAVWILIPDKEEDAKVRKYGAFFTTFVAFFLAEMGDKTQLATVAMAAKQGEFLWVTIGTTLGMMFSDGLAVLLGEQLTKKIPLSILRYVTAGIFLLFAAALMLKNPGFF